MTEETQVATSNTSTLREKLLKGSTAKSVTIQLFGETVEFRQPSFRDIMRARSSDGNPEEMSARMIISYAFDPATGEPIFTDNDLDAIMDWPFGDDLTRANTTIAELTGVDMPAVEEELETDPLAESS